MTYRHRRRRWPAVLLVLVILVAVAAVALDLVARSATESAVASDVKSSTGAKAVSASVPAFPFLWDVLVDGKVQSVTVHATGVPVGPLTLSRVDVSTRGIHLDRHSLFDSQKVRLTGIDSATAVVTVELTDFESSIASRLGVSLAVVDGDRLAARIDGVTIASVDLTADPVIPKCNFSSTPVAGGVRLSCTVAPVPSSVVSALSERAAVSP